MRRSSYRIPNSIVALRIALAFLAARLFFVGSPGAAAAGVVLTVIAIAMDALDGFVARRMGLASKLGGVLDITADRIVEHVYWITFAVAHMVPLWMPLVVVTRSFVVDAVRGLALVRGKTAFGDSSMARSSLTRFLTDSRVMRSGYGLAKLAAFVSLGTVIALRDALTEGSLAAIEAVALVSATVAVLLCVLRGLPVLADAAAYLQPEAEAVEA